MGYPNHREAMMRFWAAIEAGIQSNGSLSVHSRQLNPEDLVGITLGVGSVTENGITPDAWDQTGLSTGAKDDQKLILGIDAEALYYTLSGDNNTIFPFLEIGETSGVPITLAYVSEPKLLPFYAGDNSDKSEPGIVYVSWPAGLHSGTILDIFAVGYSVTAVR